MMTETVLENFPEVLTVDPRFTMTNKEKGIYQGSFEEVDFAGCQVFISDMWMSALAKKEDGKEKWVNYGLKEVIDKYVRDNPDRDHRNLVLAHKLSWSTTSFHQLAEQVRRSRDYQLLRLRASGRSSEWFLLILGLGLPLRARRQVTCCSLSRQVGDLWGHAESCSECKLGRIVPTAGGGLVSKFWQPFSDAEVRVNCAGKSGTTYDLALDTYLKTGKIHGTKVNHEKDRTKRRFNAVLQTRSKKAAGTGGASAAGETPGTQLDIPVLTRKDEPDLVVGPVETEGRVYLAENPGFSEYLQTWAHDARCGFREVERLPLIPELKIKPIRGTYDAYRTLPDSLGPISAPGDVTSWNELSGQFIKGAFATGKMFIDQVVMPVNARRHPISLTETFRSMGCGIGLHYSAKKPTQTLAVLETRYLNKRTMHPFGKKAKDLAKEIVDLWWSEHVRPEWERPESFTDADLDLALDVLLKDARAKGYAERFAGTGGWDGPDGRIVRFHLKSIFKPKLKPDLYKVGLGISAWSVQSLAMFCNVFRVLTTMSVKIEKDYVVTDSYWTEDQFVKYLNRVFSTVPGPAPFGVTDGEMFDACQNHFTQEIERCYLRRLGICEEFISLYYSFRVGYLILASCSSGRAGTQKTSGEPGKLFNNGVISRCISNWLLRGVGPQVIIYKGDDFVKRQCCLEARQDRREKLDEVCSLKIRINVSRGAEFCGLILEDGKIFPSVVRKANKVSAHRFRDYEHFTEYQQALRDWVANVEQFGAEVVMACNAKMYGMPFSQVESMYDGIKSACHMNERQFEWAFQYKEEPSSLPQRDRATGRVFLGC